MCVIIVCYVCMMMTPETSKLGRPGVQHITAFKGQIGASSFLLFTIFQSFCGLIFIFILLCFRLFPVFGLWCGIEVYTAMICYVVITNTQIRDFNISADDQIQSVTSFMCWAVYMLRKTVIVQYRRKSFFDFVFVFVLQLFYQTRY